MKTTKSRRVTGGSTAENAVSGQVLVEYVIMLVLAVLLALAFVTLANGLSAGGRRLTDLVGYDVP